LENELSQFKRQGYCILENQNINAHNIFLKKLSKSIDIDIDELPNLHKSIDYSNINNLRLNAFSDINSLDLKNDLYFSQAQLFLDKLLGPDISIQNKLNLSIQLPNDDSSLLQLHTDTISGQSAFEIVLWIPFTKCFGSNSMFIIPIQKSLEMMEKIDEYSDLGMKKLEEDYKEFMHFIEISPNQVLVFSPTLFHGNIVNTTSQTRISLNCRFKNIFAPESPNPERRLGTFYQVFKTSVLTEIALSYKDPYISSL
tara:strand:- start:63 stop:827 length:765 start_codon:yes stop_codon:yes gene_type:complete